MSEEMQKVRRELSNIQDTSTRADSLSVRPSAGPLHDAGLVLVYHDEKCDGLSEYEGTSLGCQVWRTKKRLFSTHWSVGPVSQMSVFVQEAAFFCNNSSTNVLIASVEEPGQSHVSHLHQWGLTLSVSCSKRKVFSFQTVELKQSGDAGVFLEECTFSPALVWPLPV